MPANMVWPLCALMLTLTTSPVAAADEGLLERLWTKVLDIPGELRFDMYSRAFVALNAIKQKTWEHPTAKDVPRPVAQTADVPLFTADLAGVSVPRDDETWDETSDVAAFAQSVLAKTLPFPSTAEECGEWAEGEDAAGTIRKLLREGLTPVRTLVPWGPEKYSDAGFSSLMFGGIGQHRVERVRKGDVHAEGAMYAVYLGFAEGLSVKPGFARYGGNAYFNAEGDVTHIWRGGRTYYPSGEQGWPKHTSTELHSREECEAAPWHGEWEGCSWTSLLGVVSRSARKCTCVVPAKIGWAAAKQGVLGTLSAVMNAVDHVYALHFVASNAVVQANVEELPPTHPVRRLMHPFGFRSGAINYDSAFAMASEKGLLHRATAFTKEGLEDLFDHAKTSGMFKWAPIPERHAAQRVELKLPLHEDGDDFYAVLKAFVSRYLAKHYHQKEEGDACLADPQLVAWLAKVNSLTPHQDLPEATCQNLEDVLATLMYLVTAAHTHVGSVGAEYEDPCHMPWAWVEGELCGAPRTVFTQTVILALRGLEQPLLLEDYTHLFDDAEEQEMWTAFQAELRAFDGRVAARNEQRRRFFKTFALKHVEISVAQ